MEWCTPERFLFEICFATKPYRTCVSMSDNSMGNTQSAMITAGLWFWLWIMFETLPTVSKQFVMLPSAWIQ